MISFELMNQIKHSFASLRGLDTNPIDALVVFEHWAYGHCILKMLRNMRSTLNHLTFA